MYLIFVKKNILKKLIPTFQEYKYLMWEKKRITLYSGNIYKVLKTINSTSFYLSDILTYTMKSIMYF